MPGLYSVVHRRCGPVGEFGEKMIEAGRAVRVEEP